ncbi:MAG: diguanylate cyclase domain-containing protein [Aquabacterium sp.]
MDQPVEKAEGVAHGPARPPALPGPVAHGDGPDDPGSMLGAVIRRLGQLAERPAGQDVRGAMRDCVAALEQIGARLALARAQRLRQAPGLSAARSALVRARAEIAAARSDERRARWLSLHDDLTALPNRAYFGEWLGQALLSFDRPRLPLAVLYLDLDGFKPINDTHGHDVGDQLLRIVATRLARALRTEDVVSRLGGDEFACVLTNLAGRDQVSQVACKLFDLVSAPVSIGQLAVVVRPSIGIALCPTDGNTPEGLLRSADAAMYHAKRQGSGYAFFDPDLLRRQPYRLQDEAT